MVLKIKSSITLTGRQSLKNKPKKILVETLICRAIVYGCCTGSEFVDVKRANGILFGKYK